MILRYALLLFAILELSLTVLYRWRTWRDQGLIALFAIAGITIFFFTPSGAALYENVCAYQPGPLVAVGGAIIAALVGLLGVSPLPVALFLGWVHPNFALTLWITLPLVLGAVPQVLLRAFTLPPRGR